MVRLHVHIDTERTHTGIFLLGTEEILDLVTNFTVWELDIVLGGTVVGHQGEATIISDIKLAID